MHLVLDRAASLLPSRELVFRAVAELEGRGDVHGKCEGGSILVRACRQVSVAKNADFIVEQLHASVDEFCGVVGQSLHEFVLRCANDVDVDI